MLTHSPVTRSRGARTLFLLGAGVTAGILLWAHQLRLSGGLRGLSPIFFILFAFEDYWATALQLLILVAAVFLASRVPATPILRWCGAHPWRIALPAAVALAAGSLFVYHDHPLSMDEYAAWFQSRIFAAGHIAGRFPPALRDWLIPPGFQDFFLQVSHLDGRVTSTYWPGHAFLMAPFTFAGMPWAFNPVVTALTLVVIHRIALGIFGDVEAAGLALLLTLASPVIFGLGISYYSMPAHLLANCLYTLLLLRPTAARVFGAGVVGSVALTLHNPVPHALYALPWLAWVASRPGGARLLGLMMLGYAPLALTVDLGWFGFSNELRREGRQAMAVALSTPERVRALLSAFSAPDATVLLARAIGAAKIWIWAVPGLLLLAAAGAVHRRANPFCSLLAASAVVTFAGYLFFTQDQGHGWGYRYFHSAWLALPLLATAAMYRPRGGGAAGDPGAGLFEDGGSRQFVVTCALLTLVAGVGWRAWQMQDFMANDIAQVPHYPGREPRIVIIDPTFSFYGGDLIQNDPFLRGDEIRMFSHGSRADAAMMAQHYPRLHEVYHDRYGSVWSQAPVTTRPPGHAR